MTKNMIKITYFQRKRFVTQNFSVEFIFEDVRTRLQNRIDAKLKILTYYSKGIFPRFYNMVESVFHQNNINHITGDISYVGILLQKKRTIQTILDCGFLLNKTSVQRFLLWFFWLYLPIKRAKKITTISNFVKNDILENVNCDPDKIVVIPVAVSNIFKPSPKIFNEKCPNLLQIGTTPNKNLIRLIKAIEGMSCRLTIVGKLSNEHEEALKLSKINYFNFVNISQQSIYEKYIECDILTFVSTYEGFGMPIIEANCIERVVITSNISSMPEVAGEAACLVDPFSIEDIREGIYKIINDNEFRSGLIQKGQVNRQRFNPDVIADAYLQIYKDILDKK